MKIEMSADKIIDYIIKSNATLEEVIAARQYLDELLNCEKILCALESAGVDNWNGYYYAMQELENYEEDE